MRPRKKLGCLIQSSVGTKDTGESLQREPGCTKCGNSWTEIFSRDFWLTPMWDQDRDTSVSLKLILTSGHHHLNTPQMFLPGTPALVVHQLGFNHLSDHKHPSYVPSIYIQSVTQLLRSLFNLKWQLDAHCRGIQAFTVMYSPSHYTQTTLRKIINTCFAQQ